MKWRTEWMQCDAGIIPQTQYRGGSYIAVKFVGQSIVDNAPRLIIQPMLGTRVGNRGFFYATRLTVNRAVKHGAFMFLDLQALSNNSKSWQMTPKYLSSIDRDCTVLVRDANRVHDLLMFLANREGRTTRPHRKNELMSVLGTLPTALLFAFVGPYHIPSHPELEQLSELVKLYTIQSNSQIAFYWSCVADRSLVKWVHRYLERQMAVWDARRSVLEEQTARRRATIDERRMSAGLSGVMSHSSVVEVSPAESGTLERSISVSEAGSAVHVPQPPPEPPKPSGKKAPARPKGKTKIVTQEEQLINRQQQLLNINADMLRAQHESLLTEVTATNRREKEDRNAQALKFQRKSSFAWEPKGKSEVKLDNLHVVRSFSLDVLSLPWTSVNIPLADDPRGGTIAMFLIGPYMCRYDTAVGSIATPLVRMSQDPDFAAFPLSNGVDTALLVTDTEGCFFSEGYWVKWDLCRNALIGGPYRISEHWQFKELPAIVRDNLRTVIPILSSEEDVDRRAVFVSKDATYCVFNLTNAEAEGGVYSFVTSDGPYGLWAKWFPSGPTAALASGDAEIALFGTNGRLATFSFKTSSFVDSDDSQPFGPSFAGYNLAQSAFKDLPDVFLQGTTIGLLAALNAMKKNVPSGRLINIEPFKPHPPLQNTVAPSTAIGGLDVSAMVEIKLANGEIEENCEVASLIQPLDYDGTAHLADDTSVVIVRGAGSTTTLVVDYDFGILNSCRFGYLQIVFSEMPPTSTPLANSPMPILIESSHDGVAYRSVGHNIIYSQVFDMYWDATHFARYWRITINRCPVGAKLCRTLWHSAHWVADSRLYTPKQPFDIGKTPASVRLWAAHVYQEPCNLLDSVARGAIFSTNPSDKGWREKHCWLPLLPPAQSALVFVGECFAEWDFLTNEVVGHRINRIGEHPAFKKLPFPFCYGIDAAFYPDPLHSRNVVFINGELALEWNLDAGKPEGVPVSIIESFWLNNLPSWIARKIDSIVNIWERPGQIFIFSGGSVVRWSVLRRQVVEGPSPRSAFEILHVPAFGAEDALLTAATFPAKPFCVYLFKENQYSIVEYTRDRRLSSISEPQPMAESAEFHRLCWLLKWGAERKETVVTVDFGEANPMFVGCSLRSGSGLNPETTWNISCSVDFANWIHVADHRQTTALSSTSWSPATLGCRGYRYWRLSTDSVGINKEVAYNQLLFQVLPSVPFSISPLVVEGTAQPNVVDVNFLLQKEVLFPFSNEKGCPSGSLILDYGRDGPPELVELSFIAIGEVYSDLWSVAFSDDGVAWTEVGRWRIRTKKASMSWCPLYPHRFWKVELHSSDSARSVKFRDFRFKEYSGPAVEGMTKDCTSIDALSCLLKDNFSDSRLIIPATEGEALQLDFKADPQNLVGLSLVADVDTFDFNTTFAVEFSDDSNEWTMVSTAVVCDDIGMSAWENEGKHRFWRVRVTRHYGPNFVALKHFGLMICGPTL